MSLLDVLMTLLMTITCVGVLYYLQRLLDLSLEQRALLDRQRILLEQQIKLLKWIAGGKR